MSDDFLFVVEGLSTQIERFDELPAHLRRFAMQTINTTARRYRAEASREIRKQVAFSASYLSDKQGRLSVTKQAQQGDLEARITGRSRPTSLARFATGTPQASRRRGGVPVQVSPGRHAFMARAFLMSLRSGKADIETRKNLGLALRLRPGETVRNKRVSLQQVGRDKRLFLLYGPSVDQVFDDVAKQVSPEAADFMEHEFLRLVNL